MALEVSRIIQFLDNPGQFMLEALEATARLAVTGPGFTLSLAPAAAIGSFLGIVALIPFAGYFIWKGIPIKF